MRRYRVQVDNEATGGVEVDLDVSLSDLADNTTLEVTIAEATRRLLAAVRAEPSIEPVEQQQ